MPRPLPILCGRVVPLPQQSVSMRVPSSRGWAGARRCLSRDRVSMRFAPSSSRPNSNGALEVGLGGTTAIPNTIYYPYYIYHLPQRPVDRGVQSARQADWLAKGPLWLQRVGPICTSGFACPRKSMLSECHNQLLVCCYCVCFPPKRTATVGYRFAVDVTSINK